MALAYIVERAHPNYARPPAARQAGAAHQGGRGLSGANLDYLVSTVRHLGELGIRERELERLVTHDRPLAWQRSRAQHTSPYAAALVRRSGCSAAPVRRLARKDERRRFLYRLRLERVGRQAG